MLAESPVRKKTVQITAEAALAKIGSYHAELTGIRRDIANPELGLETHRTADIVARLLSSWVN